MTTEQQAILAKVKPLIMADAKQTGVPASLTAAQMMIESGWLKSGLTVKANNAFGIKGSYHGAYYSCLTKEFVGGKYVTITAKFKAYPSLAESIADHSALLCKPRYAAVRAAKDYKAARKAVKACGYATAPDYADTLIRFIEQYRLYEWDAPQSVPDKPSVFCKGDVVQFTGGYHYAASGAKTAVGVPRKAGRAKVTGVAKGAKHPYHVIAVAGGGSNVYGWVDAEEVASL